MGDVEGQRRLLQVAAPDFDSGRGARRRLPSVGADHQSCRQNLALAGANRNRRVIGRDGRGLVVITRQVGKFGGALFERCYQRAVVDVVAELFEPDLIG